MKKTGKQRKTLEIKNMNKTVSQGNTVTFGSRTKQKSTHTAYEKININKCEWVIDILKQKNQAFNQLSINFSAVLSMLSRMLYSCNHSVAYHHRTSHKQIQWERKGLRIINNRYTNSPSIQQK